jgi:hypothetical protein
MICPTGEAKYFCKGDSTGFSTARPSGKSLGNPLSCFDANTNMSETFAYDRLNRLTSATVNATPTPRAKTVFCSTIGNLLPKSDVGAYTALIPSRSECAEALSRKEARGLSRRRNRPFRRA